MPHYLPSRNGPIKVTTHGRISARSLAARDEKPERPASRFIRAKVTALFTLERERVINLKTGKGRDEWVARPKRRRSWTDEALRAALDEIGRRKVKAVLMGSNTEEVARRVVPDAFPVSDSVERDNDFGGPTAKSDYGRASGER